MDVTLTRYYDFYEDKVLNELHGRICLPLTNILGLIFMPYSALPYLPSQNVLFFGFLDILQLSRSFYYVERKSIWLYFLVVWLGYSASYNLGSMIMSERMTMALSKLDAAFVIVSCLFMSLVKGNLPASLKIFLDVASQITYIMSIESNVRRTLINQMPLSTSYACCVLQSMARPIYEHFIYRVIVGSQRFRDLSVLKELKKSLFFTLAWMVYSHAKCEHDNITRNKVVLLLSLLKILWEFANFLFKNVNKKKI